MSLSNTGPSSVVLKVVLPDEDRSKSLKFETDWKVGQVVTSIQQRLHRSEDPEFGVFIPGGNCWLREDEELWRYNLPPMTAIEYCDWATHPTSPSGYQALGTAFTSITPTSTGVASTYLVDSSKVSLSSSTASVSLSGSFTSSIPNLSIASPSAGESKSNPKITPRKDKEKDKKDSKKEQLKKEKGEKEKKAKEEKESKKDSKKEVKSSSSSLKKSQKKERANSAANPTTPQLLAELTDVARARRLTSINPPPPEGGGALGAIFPPRLAHVPQYFSGGHVLSTPSSTSSTSSSSSHTSSGSHIVSSSSSPNASLESNAEHGLSSSSGGLSGSFRKKPRPISQLLAVAKAPPNNQRASLALPKDTRPTIIPAGTLKAAPTNAGSAENIILTLEAPEEKLTRTMEMCLEDKIEVILFNLQKKNPISNLEDYALFLKDHPNIELDRNRKLKDIKMFFSGNKPMFILKRVCLHVRLSFLGVPYTLLEKNTQVKVKEVLDQFLKKVESHEVPGLSKAQVAPQADKTILYLKAGSGGIALDPARTVLSYRLGDKDVLDVLERSNSTSMLVAIESPEHRLSRKFRFETEATVADVINTFVKKNPVQNPISSYGMFLQLGEGAEGEEYQMDLTSKLSAFGLLHKGKMVLKPVEEKRQVRPQVRKQKKKKGADQTILVSVIGKPGAGKHSLVQRFATKRFAPSGIDRKFFGTHSMGGGLAGLNKVLRTEVAIDLGKQHIPMQLINYELNTATFVGIQDVTGGSNEQLNAVVMCFDIMDSSSFDAIANVFGPVTLQLPESTVIVIVGLKSDLEQTNVEQYQASITKAQAFCEEKKVIFVETSALSGTNVSELFHCIAEIFVIDPSTRDGPTLDLDSLGFAPSSYSWAWMRKRMNFGAVEELILSNNPIVSVPFISHFTALKRLDLTGNPRVNLLADLTALEGLKQLEDIVLDNLPPHAKGAALVMQHLKNDSVRSQLCYKLKLMILGGEKTGKSSILKGLREGRSNRSKIKAEREGSIPTLDDIGIRGRLDIKKWEDIQVNKEHNIEFSCLDFNGSIEVAKAVHPLFVSDRCIYIIVFNMSEGVEGVDSLDFWLQSLEARGLKHPPPVIIVGTHTDLKDCTDEFKAHTVGLLEQRYFKRFPNISAVNAVSNTTKTGYDALKKEIEALARKQPPVVVPNNYFALAQAVQEEHFTTPLVPVTRLREIWGKISPPGNGDTFDSVGLSGASQFLSDIGTWMYLNDSSAKLGDMVIVNPSNFVLLWTELLRGKHDFIDDGLVKRSDWALAWTTLPPNAISFLVNIMKRFDMIFPLPSKRGEAERLLIPAMLPKESPEGIETIWPPCPTTSQPLQYSRTYKLEYVPNGLFSRLLLRLLHYSSALTYWHNGVVVSANTGKASEVRAMIKMASNEVDILVRGAEATNTAGFMRTIVEMLDLLLQYWYDIKHEISIRCPHCIQIDPNGTATKFTLEQCDKNAAEGLTIFTCKENKIPLDSIAPDVAMTDFSGQTLDPKSVVTGMELAANKYRKVSKGTWSKRQGSEVAIKEFLFPVDRTPVEVFKEFRREVWTMSALQHPNVVRLLGFSPHPMVVVMEFIPHGDLYEFLERKDLSWPMRLKIALDIAQGMTFLHSSTPPLLHRDLKTPNVFMASLSCDAPVVCKVGDFGMSSRLYIDELQETAQRAVDNPTWLAPEVLKGNPYTEKSDVYAFGVMLWELISNARPFSNCRWFYEIEDFVNKGGRPDIPEGLNAEYAELIRNTWHEDIHQRPTFEECLIILLRLKDQLAPSLCTPIFSKYPADSPIITNYLEGETTVSLLEGSLQKKITLPEIEKVQVNCLLWVGTHVWAGAADGTIIIWNTGGSLVARYQAHWEAIHHMVIIGKTVWTLSSFQVCGWQANLLENSNEKGEDTRRSMTNDNNSFFGKVEKKSGKDKNKTKSRCLSLASGTLYSYLTETDVLPSKIYPIEQGTTVEKDKQKEGGFVIRQPDGKRRSFVASPPNQVEVWLTCLQDTVNQVSHYTDLRLKRIAQHDFQVALTCLQKLGNDLCVGIYGRTIRVFKSNGGFDDAVIEAEPSSVAPTEAEELWNNVISTILECDNGLYAAVWKHIYKLDPKTLQPTGVLKGHNEAVLHLAMVEGSIWSYGLDYTIRLWDLESAKCVKIIPCAGVSSLTQVGCEVWVARQVTKDVGLLSVWSLDSFKNRDLPAPTGITSMALVWDKEMWVASENSVSVWI